jgi:hypothetical protein
MSTRALLLGLLSIAVAAPALAQGAGGPSGGAPAGGRGGGPAPTAEEAARAANAKEWADVIDKARAKAPPPALPQIHFPSENEKLLSKLRWSENPQKELAQYLDRLWKDAREAPQQRVAVETLWHDAEKPKWVPKWVRPAIEDYYRQHSSGGSLRTPMQPMAQAGAAEGKGAAQGKGAPEGKGAMQTSRSPGGAPEAVKSPGAAPEPVKSPGAAPEPAELDKKH